MEDHHTEKQEEEESMISITVRLPPVLVEHIDSHADQDDRTRGGMIRKVLSDYYLKRSET